MKPAIDSLQTAKVVGAILNSTHHNTQDFTVTIPAALLAQPQRPQTISRTLIVAIAAILLAGGRHRDHEHRAGDSDGAHARDRHTQGHGARRKDIVRQFLVESVPISVAGMKASQIDPIEALRYKQSTEYPANLRRSWYTV
jgi:putative ABC transport system permease protein